MLAAYRQADRYSDRASYVLETVRRSEGVKRDTLLFEFSLAWERPNKIRFRYQRMVPASEQKVSFDIASNGRVVHSIAGELPQQVQETIAPDKLTPENFIPDPYIRETVLQVSLENLYPQLLMLLTAGEDESVFSADSNPRLLGQQKLRGFDCHRVVLEGPAGQRILWIDVDNSALRRMELPVAAQLSTLDPHQEFSHYSVWIDYLEPTIGAEPILGAKTDAQVFTLDIPEGARRMRQLVLPPPLPPLAILGRPVADFSFTTLEGEEVSPATLSGKVVLMEFWSKTCPPCRVHTPLLDQVYRELKDSKDFVFYAVNTNSAATSNVSVSRLFKSWGGSIPVLRDLQQTSYTQLDIGAYPHTILVGRDGRLQMYQPGMHVRPEPLVATVRKLLDGGDLAAEVHASHAERVERYQRELEAATIQEKSPEPITQTPTGK